MPLRNFSFQQLNSFSGVFSFSHTTTPSGAKKAVPLPILTVCGQGKAMAPLFSCCLQTAGGVAESCRGPWKKTFQWLDTQILGIFNFF